MKKIIGYSGAYIYLWIGDLSCKIGYIKYKGEYIFDNQLSFMSGFIFNSYNYFIVKSSNIQDWAKIDGPWKNVENE